MHRLFNGVAPNSIGINTMYHQPITSQNNSEMLGINSGGFPPNVLSPMGYNMLVNNNMPQNSLIQNLKNMNYTNWESELFKFYYGQNRLYIFPKMDKVRNLNYLSQILMTNLTTNPLNCINYFPQENVWVINGFQTSDTTPSNNEIIQFCEQMRSKNIFLNLNTNNFIYTPIGIFIKNPDCFLIRPFLHGSFFSPKCPCFHTVCEDFPNGIHSEDKLYWCPTCGRHYHQSEIDFSQIKKIIEEIK